MYTYQMVGLADENGRTYECKYGTYDRENGFKFNEVLTPLIKDEGWRVFINTLFHDDMWKLKQDPIREMSLQDIERELGYRVQIVDPKPDKKISKKKKKEIDDTVRFFRDYLGVDLNPEDYY